jgi:hypothetical protein
MTQPTINRLANKNLTASLGLAILIENATGGVVEAEKLSMSKRSRQALRLIRKMAA